MKKLRIIGVILIALIGIALVAPWFIPADIYKQLLEQQVKKATGRDLKIEGDARLQLLPSLALTVGKVSFSNPEGYADTYLAQIEKLSVDVELRPLLEKRLVIKGVSIEDANIALEQKVDGSKNWEFSKASKKEQINSNAASSVAKSPLSRLVLGDVHIKNSSVTLRKPNSKPVAVEHINLDVNSSGFSSPLSADMNMEYLGERVSGNFNIDSIDAFLKGQLTPTKLQVSLPASVASFSGKTSLSEGLHAKGDIVVSLSDIQKLQLWTTDQKPTSSAIKSLKFNSAVSMESDTLRLANIVLSTDALDAKGDLAILLGQSVPSIKGALNLGALNLDAFKSASSANNNQAANNRAATSNASGDWSDAPIDLSALKKANVNISLAAESVASGKIKLGATSFVVILQDGNLRINDIASKLYGGSGSGNLSLTSAGAITSAMKLQAIEIEDLMKALSGKSRLAGTATLNFALNANGKSVRGWVNALAGKGDMFVRDGAILGINIGKFLRDAKQGFILSDNSTERTDFAEMSASFTVNAGVLSNSDLLLKAPALRLLGQGTVSLPPKTINYKLTPKIAATAAGQGGKDDKSGIAIPLLITGSWSNPSITPDIAGALEEGLNNPEAIKANVNAVKDAVSGLNSPKDLKNALGGILGKKLGADTGAAEQPASPEQNGAPDLKQGLGNLIKGF